MTKIFKINISLGVLIVILAIFTINWHNQMYLMHKKSIALNKKNNQLIAMHKQLLTERAKKNSGEKIKQNIDKALNMKVPKSIGRISL